MRRHVIGQVFPDILKDHSVFIFRVKQSRIAEDGGTTVIQNISKYPPDDTVSHPRRIVNLHRICNEKDLVDKQQDTTYLCERSQL
jgi:hypothetical protein